jgi:hypothetical protein
MDLFLIATGVIGVWAFFAIVGNERQRRLQRLELELLQARQRALAEAAKQQDIPVLT